MENSNKDSNIPCETPKTCSPSSTLTDNSTATINEDSMVERGNHLLPSIDTHIINNIDSTNKVPLSMGDINLANSNTNPHTDNTNLGICIEALSNGFLSDDMIHNYFQLLSIDIADPKIALISLVVGQAIKCLEDVDFILTPLGLSEKSHIFIPVNDAEAGSEGSGKHWSLLLYTKRSNVFNYFDSMNQMNLPSAKKILNKVSGFISQKEPTLNVVNSPLQNNGVDCGVYVILAVDWLLKEIRSGSLDEQEARSFNSFRVQEHEIILKRALLAYLTYNNQYRKLQSSVIRSLIFNKSTEKLPNVELTNAEGNLPKQVCYSNAILPNSNNANVNSKWTQVKNNRSNQKLENTQNRPPEYSLNISNQFQILENLDQNSMPVSQLNSRDNRGSVYIQSKVYTNRNASRSTNRNTKKGK